MPLQLREILLLSIMAICGFHRDFSCGDRLDPRPYPRICGKDPDYRLCGLRCELLWRAALLEASAPLPGEE